MVIKGGNEYVNDISLIMLVGIAQRENVSLQLEIEKRPSSHSSRFFPFWVSGFLGRR